MELNITTDFTVIPQSIDWNFEELKTQLAPKLEYYRNLVVTEDGVRAAKADKASLNLLKNAIEEKRKEVKRICLSPYEAFERQCKELVGMIQSPITAIDVQIKNFDEQRKREKYRQLKSYYDSIIGELAELVPFDKILNPKYGNVGMKIGTLQLELSDRIAQCRSDMETLQKQFADKPNLTAILAKYGENLSLSQTLVYAAYLQEETEKQRRIEKHYQPQESVRKTYAQEQSKTPEELMRRIQTETAAPDPVGSVQFRVTCTRSQLIALRDFMKKSGIVYQVIKTEE